MADEVEIHAARCGEVVADKYVLTNVLGVGGMGVVYAALQRSLDRVVALKVPRPELAADPEVRDRFHLEALASSRIQHRNCVRVFDYGKHVGAPYLVMEHVAGPRLGQLLAEHGPLQIGVAVSLVRQIVSVLEEAHANGIVHGDVKCDNILVETLRDGSLSPRLIDWGVAHFSDRRDTKYAAVITGTPEYLAPEVILGESPTFAADVYAIGVMLYELVAGATPFASSSHVMVTKLEELALPLRVRCPELDIPSPLDAIVLRALARDPASRYFDAAALGRALDSISLSDAQRRMRADASTTLFSTEAATAEMAIGPLAEGSYSRARVVQADVACALETGDVDAIIVAYLELARTLVDEHLIGQAIVELERAIESLSEAISWAPVWRLLLTLAALYDGNGDRRRARAAARLAREGAARAGSSVGCERAERLVARLSPSRVRQYG